MSSCSIVVLFGSNLEVTGHTSVRGERSVLSRVIDDADEPHVTVISAAARGALHGVECHIDLSGNGPSPQDRILNVFCAQALRDRLGSFPLGRLLNSMGPADQGRVFWRTLRRDPAALSALKSADVVIAGDLPAVKSAWLALNRNWVRNAYYDHRAASHWLTTSNNT